MELNTTVSSIVVLLVLENIRGTQAMPEETEKTAE
jgi:hypothetical protein